MSHGLSWQKNISWLNEFLHNSLTAKSRPRVFTLQKIMSIHIEILTKEDCSLCDDAKAIVESVLPDYPATLKMVDIESDPILFESYKEKIPVVRINGEESFVFKTHETTLRKKLDILVK